MNAIKKAKPIDKNVSLMIFFSDKKCRSKNEWQANKNKNNAVSMFKKLVINTPLIKKKSFASKINFFVVKICTYLLLCSFILSDFNDTFDVFEILNKATIPIKG